MEPVNGLSTPSSDFDVEKFDIARRFVRVTGKRPNGFIEFDYAVGEPEIFVELILAEDDFKQFCKDSKVKVLPSEVNHPVAEYEWGWRMKDATSIRFKHTEK